MKVGTYCSPLTWFAIRALRWTGLLSRLNFSVNARINDQAIKVPVKGGVGINLLISDETWMNLLLKDLLKKFNGAFLDVGVNVGQTLCKVKTLEPERAYVGFEPNPLCVHYVQELVGLHYFRNVRLLPIGLSDQDGVLELELHTEDLADSSATIVRNFRPRHKVFRSMAIQVRRFGSVDRELGIGKLGIIKIDVEGAEKEVLLGLEETLIRDRPAVIVEILPVGNIPERAQRQADVEALFKRCRYALQRIGMRGDKLTLEPVNGAIGVLHDQKLSNYVALPD